MNKLILGLVGEMASGKGTVADHLINNHNAISLRFSTPLRESMSRLYLDLTRPNIQKFSQIMREAFGQDMLAKIIAKDAQATDNNLIVIDGIRRPADIEYLKNLKEFKLAYITADLKIRYERIIQRGENADDNNKTLEQFEAEHQAETELLIPELGKTAEIQINNNGDIDELKAQIDKIIKDANQLLAPK